MKQSYLFIVFSLFVLTACSGNGGAGSDSHSSVSLSMKIPSASSVSAVEKPVSEGVVSIEARVLNSAGSLAAKSEERNVAPNDEVVIDFVVPLGQMTFIVEAFSEKESQGTLLFRGEKTENMTAESSPSIIIEMQAVGGIIPQNPAVVKGETLQFSMSGIDSSQVGWRLKSTPSRFENSIGTLDEMTGFYQAPLAIPYDFSDTRSIGLPVMIDVEAFDISSSETLDVVSLKVVSDGKFVFNLRNQITPPGTGSASTQSLSAGQRNIAYHEGNAYAVWEQGGQILFSETVFSRGGPLWTDPLVLPGVGFTQKSAAIAVDLKGNLYVAFIDRCFGTGCDSLFQKVVLLVRKVVDGVPEADFTQISLGDENDDTGPLSQNPTLAVSPDGAIVFVAWSSEAGDGGNDILFQRVNPVDGTKIDKNPKSIVSTAEDDEQPTMGVAKDGKVYLAWIEEGNTVTPLRPNLLMAAVSLNGDGKFESPVQVNHPDSEFGVDRRPSLVPGEDGTVYITWEKDTCRGDSCFRVAHNKGTLSSNSLTFEAQDQLFEFALEPTNSRRQFNPSIAWDGANGVYIVLQERSETFQADERFKYGIFVTKSADNGATFGPLQPVDDNFDDAEKTKFKDLPSIAVDETGRVFVLWTDVRGGIAPRYIWFALSEFPLL